MLQQIITWALVVVAAALLLRHVWRQVEGLVHPDRAGECPGCGMCEAAERDAAGKRPAPEIKVTPLVRLDTKTRHR